MPYHTTPVILSTHNLNVENMHFLGFVAELQLPQRSSCRTRNPDQHHYSAQACS